MENAIIRAAAVTALAKFGVGQKDPELKRSVKVLLTRCLDDTDDEVRDRAALNLRLMKEKDELAERFIKPGKDTWTDANFLIDAGKLMSFRFDVFLIHI